MATELSVMHEAPQTPPRPKMQFPFLDLKAQFASIKDEVMAAIAAVMEQQHFILGPEVENLEKEVAALAGCEFAVGCASGSDALLLALMALGVDAGDEVITTPFTFVATAGSIARLKARPVFVDIDPETFNLDPQRVAAAITPRTRAIIPVHLFGLAADMRPVLDNAGAHDLPVIEDAAQAIGARYQGDPVGTLGAMGCFSFFPSKNLGGCGDGGMITTNDRQMADRLRLLRVHGSRSKYQYEVLGINSRLDALQAAILRVKLRYLDQWAAGRRRNAERYREMFRQFAPGDAVKLPAVPEGCVHVYNQFTIRAQRRDALQAYLKQAGIPTEIYYPSPLHLQPAFAYLGHKLGDFPEAEKAAGEVLSLPIFPELTEAQQSSVVEAIAAFFSAHRIESAATPLAA